MRKFRPYKTNKVDDIGKSNLLKQEFEAEDLNQKWVGDITYIYTLREGWTYLATVMDLCSRKIIGYSYQKSMTTELIIEALEDAIKGQEIKEGLIFHSDLGSQYTSVLYEEKLSRYGIQHSYSKKGCPYDNACIESFHSLLKKEEVNQVTYIDYEAAKLSIFEYIESWYNRQRIHSSLGYKTPNEVEREMQQLA